MADKLDNSAIEESPRKPPRQFKKCKSATFSLDGMNYMIGKTPSGKSAVTDIGPIDIMGLDARKPVFGGLHPLSLISPFVILCCWGDWFESHFFRNHEDSFRPIEALIKLADSLDKGTYCTNKKMRFTRVPRAVGNVSGNRCESVCRSRGREFDPGPVPYRRLIM